jgi:hypothetical protein
MTDGNTVSVPDDLYERCEQNIENTDFESVEQYIQFILSEVFKGKNEHHHHTVEKYDVAEEQLEALGYLDQ